MYDKASILVLIAFIHLIILMTSAQFFQVTRVDPPEIDNEYMDYHSTVMNANEGKISLVWNVTKRFPTDASISAELFRINDIKTTHVDNYSTPICQGRRLIFNLFPLFIRKITAAPNCPIRPRVYRENNAGQFLFEHTRDLRKFKTHKFSIVTSITTRSKTIITYTVYSNSPGHSWDD